MRKNELFELVFEKMIIGLTQQIGKLVFVASPPSFLSLRTSALKWCGNPPVERNQVTITTKNRGELHPFWCFSVHFPTNRGIATPVCGLVRNDSVF